ncbi:hypothetical protein ILYODFUR_016128 [Ilyodon furcidens]|uniref:Uncharacterized protein n=1 Tax=Ilyodon furcidens TaxID=33524 RepID=A0ABV0VEF6_9TELE
MKEKPPSSSCSPGNIRETRTRLSLLDVSHASQEEEEHAAHTVKIKGKKKSECPLKVTVAPVKLGQHRGRFSLFWSSRTWTGRRNTFRRSSSLCVRRAAASTGSVHSRVPDARLNRPGVHWSKAARRERARVCQVTLNDRCQRQPLAVELLNMKVRTLKVFVM